MVQINWTKLALTDLKEIHDYIARDSRKYAKLQVIRIRSQTTVLKKQTSLGRIVPEIRENNIRELIFGNYRIIYRIVTNTRIDIITIHHSARDLSKRVQK